MNEIIITIIIFASIAFALICIIFTKWHIEKLENFVDETIETNLELIKSVCNKLSR